MKKRNRDNKFLQLIDGLESDNSRKAFANNEFTPILYENQERRKKKIVSQEYTLIDKEEDKISLLEKMLCHYPNNLCVKLSLTIGYFESNNLKHLGLLALREIEEAIAINPTSLSDLQNEESFIDKIIAPKIISNDFAQELVDNATERLQIARHFLDFGRLKSLKKDSQSLYDLLIISYASVILRNNNEALSSFRTIEKEHPTAVFVYNLYARRLEASNYRQEAENKRALFSSWALHDSDTKFQRINNAIRSVYELNNETAPLVNKTLISIRTKSKDEIVYEQKAIHMAKKIVQEHEFYRVVESAHTECINGIYHHVFRRKNGEVLLSFLEDESNKDEQLTMLLDTTLFLQLLQFNMGGVVICDEKTCENLAIRLSARLQSNGVKLSNEIENSLAQLCRNFLFIPVVYNKDSHPENWIITKSHSYREKQIITALDFQEKEPMPCVFDLANLLRYGNYIKEKHESTILEEYYQLNCSANNYFKNITYQQFSESYHAAVVYRMLSFFCAWQHPRKAGYSTRIPLILNNAINIIKKYQHEKLYEVKLAEFIDSMR